MTVLIVAIGMLNGLAIATASAIARPLRRNSGTVITLPPTPSTLAIVQLARPPAVAAEAPQPRRV